MLCYAILPMFNVAQHSHLLLCHVLVLLVCKMGNSSSRLGHLIYSRYGLSIANTASWMYLCVSSIVNELDVIFVILPACVIFIVYERIILQWSHLFLF
ncbi:hypothetical protein FB192DRAFT_1385754 [Mucor lusitanicus]|uniref:Uncharacterized protein n=1 Tax=Mucor circinelloides f. lusitanicus TaxID=29924 RepID=A0A8H4F0E7_MUCCL|nr:hypothetical protein FB192DRAFT_1385754 [Mucor lusitanicus]